MIHIIPIAQTQPDWPLYLRLTKEALHRSVSKPLDAAGKKPEGLAPWIVTLGEMMQPGATMSLLKNAGQLLAHASVSMLVACDHEDLWAVLESSRLSIASVPVGARDLAVVTGDLSCWRTTIIDGCSEVASAEIREFCGAAMTALEGLGLGEIWADYRKTPFRDSTFALVRR